MAAHEYPESFARFYDLIYHQLRDSVDHEFFMHEVGKCRGRILEIGAGTGRFFTDALGGGHDVYGIDISDSMIRVLKQKLEPAQHFRITRQSMVDFSFGFQFELIIAPFRVFMHLLDKDSQIAALNNVCRHLTPNGRFIFDTFIPDLNLLIHGIDNQTDFEGEYEQGKSLKRTVSSRPDLVNQIIHVSFKLEWEEGNSVRTETWDLPLRYYFRYELEHLVERSDFTNYRIIGDYHGHELDESSKDFIVECTQ